jgi:hypothetical protein
MGQSHQMTQAFRVAVKVQATGDDFDTYGLPACEVRD